MSKSPPPPPRIRLELVEDLSPGASAGFLRLIRRRLRAIYPDGSKSEPFVYDEVDRTALDAVVIAAHYQGADARRWVYLRSAVRPPLVQRDRTRSPVEEPDDLGCMWELPAGLVEADEQSAAGLRVGAARELAEELGFDVVPSALTPLGPSTFPAPGICAERHFYFEVSVDPGARRAPHNDGSALENFGEVISVPLEEAIRWCRAGVIPDAKTELALCRLSEMLR